MVPADIFARWRAGAPLADLVVLPPRMRRGSKGNIRRVAIHCYALHQLHIMRLTAPGRARHVKACPYCRKRVPWKLAGAV